MLILVSMQADGNEHLRNLNYLTAAEKRTEKLMEKVVELQKVFGRVQNKVVDKCLTAGKLELALQNLYIQVCEKLNPDISVRMMPSYSYQ
jgi:hypothetical protein